MERGARQSAELPAPQQIKEISYCHAEAYPSSELKHGPLALITEELPTVAVLPDDELLQRNLGALHEIAARNGPLVVVTHPGVDLGDLRARRVDVPKNEPELGPHPADHPDATARLPRRPDPRPRHRQTPKPRQISHRRMTRR